MKNLNRIIAGVLAAGGMTFAAETVDLSMPDAWENNKMIGWNAGTITTKNRFCLAMQKKFPVDPSKKYTFSFMAKSSKPLNWMLAGFQAFDARGRVILSPNVNAVAGSMTTAVKAAPAGAKSIIVKDASKWKANMGFSIVTGAKADFSDLPNFNIISNSITAVKQEGDVWKITLAKPLAKALEANTSLRLHMPGGAIYTCGITYIADKWSKISGSIKGVSKNKPGYGPYVWPAGTVSGQAIILVNWRNVKDTVTEFEELKLEIE